MSKKKTKTLTINKTDRQKFRNRIGKLGDGKIGRDIYHFIKGRYKILYIRSNEELRVLECLKLISMSEGFDMFQWDCSRGLLESHSMTQANVPSSEVHSDPLAAMSYIVDVAKSQNVQMKDDITSLSEGHIFTLLDFHIFLQGEDPQLQRKFKEFFSISSVTCIAIIAPKFECPAALDKEFTLINFPYPSTSEIKTSLNKIKKEIPSDYLKAVKFADSNEEELVKAAAGLTIVEAENAYALSLVKEKTFDIPTILREKSQIIRKSGILEYREPRFSFDDIGGLDTLKQWLQLRKMAFSEDASNFGLLSPKGTLICGVPGCVLGDTKIKIKKVSNDGDLKIFAE